MSDAESLRTVERMRREFDEAFAQPLAEAREAPQELLAIRVGDQELALRAGDAAVIVRCPALVPMPSMNEALLGLALDEIAGALTHAAGVAHDDGGRR